MSNKPSPRKSPFKAVASKNASHCGFISMSALEPHKAYMMTDFKATHHSVYGDGLLSFLKGKNNSQWRSQFPPKYLQNFSEEDIKELRRYITEEKYPFIIFREVLADKSFKIDLAPHSDELVNAHTKWLDVGAIALSPDAVLERLTEFGTRAPRRALIGPCGCAGVESELGCRLLRAADAARSRRRSVQLAC